MAAPLFVFIQFEFPWVLGPAEGRYLLRTEADGEPERVVVIGALAAGRLLPGALAARPSRLGQRRRARPRPANSEPATVPTTRATVVDPVSLSAERQAQAWLAGLDREHEVLAAAAILNRVLHTHRVASADPYLREVSPAQALVIRAGWGEGEQVADGGWLHANELPWQTGRRRDRSAALRPQERLAAVLGGRSATLMCEELVLRARLDLDQGRPAYAAVQLDTAYAAAIEELSAEARPDLAIRVAELAKLRPQVAELARLALASESTPAQEQAQAQALDEEALAHALGRLEATLRARTAGGFTR